MLEAEWGQNFGRRSPGLRGQYCRPNDMRLGGDVFRRQSNLVRESDIERLSEIKCPTLVIAGENDRIRNLDEARELNDGIPHSTLKIVPQSGHMVPMEQPSLLGELIRSWLYQTVLQKVSPADSSVEVNRA